MAISLGFPALHANQGLHLSPEGGRNAPVAT